MIAVSRGMVLDWVEAVLCHVRAEADVEALAACRAFLRLYAEPEYSLYRPGDWFADLKKELEAAGHAVRIESPGEERVGDVRSLRILLRALVRGAQLKPGAGLYLEAFEETERGERVPRIAVGLNGQGRLPEIVPFKDFFRLPWAEFNERWTLASSGGRVDQAPNGAVLRLSGMRMTPEPLSEAGEVLRLLGPEPSPRTVDRALAYLHGTPKLEPADIKGLLREVVDERRPLLSHAGLHVDTLLDSGLPPLAVRRPRLRTLLANLLEAALWSLPPEGRVELLVEFDRATQDAGIAATFTVPSGALQSPFHTASIRRAAEEHHGALEESSEANCLVFLASLPDPIGKALDEWLPGWQTLTDRSRQMLRLLRSGGQTPPEDFILGGVLEEELERWLLPRLSAHAAMHLARDLAPKPGAVPGSHPERMRKALDQVARGKPKKEICQPQYAGELFWAFNADERHRYTIGIGDMSEGDVRGLCSALLASPVDALGALRILANALRGANTPAG